MTKHDYKQNAYYLIYLVRCALNNTVPAREKVEKMDLEKIYQVARKHSLTALCAYALESAEIFDKRFEEAKFNEIRKIIILDSEREQILDDLEKNGIRYMPLKGIIIKDMYPRIGMRQMSDNDIWIDPDRTQEVEYIMNRHEFSSVRIGQGAHDVYRKKPLCLFEMHKLLFSTIAGDIVFNYYKDIESKLVRSDASDRKYEYSFTDEDLYVYIITHEYKHFSIDGTGLRSLVDTYLLLKNKPHLDWYYINKQLAVLEITGFEKKNRELALLLFEGKKLSEDNKEMLDYFIFSGTYGTSENRIRNRVTAKKGSGKVAKLKYIMSRLFLPMKQIEFLHPYFYSHRYLIPFLPFYRIYLGLTKKKKIALSEIRALIKKT